MNKDSVEGDKENESTTFFREIFNDEDDEEIQHWDVWRDRNPDRKEFTFYKMQRRNCPKAIIDYFLLSRNTTELVIGASIGRACKLSDLRPIYLQIYSSTFKMGRIFWRFDNELLKTMDFINGCNRVIADSLQRQYQGVEILNRCLYNIRNKKDEIAARKAMAR